MKFFDIYREELQKAVDAYPAEYPWASAPTVIHGNTGTAVFQKQTVDAVADKMIAAVKRGSFNKDGRAFKATCKRLGIKHTYTAINAYLKAEGTL